MPKRGQRIKNRSGYVLRKSKGGFGPNRWHKGSTGIPQRRRKKKHLHIADQNNKVQTIAENFSEKIDMNDEQILDWTEENIPDFVDVAVRTSYPGGPVQKYCWGKIAKEVIWFAIVMIRSRRDSTISIFEKMKGRWQSKIYSVNQRLPFELNINHTVLLDRR
ncbi:MAG: hypothetical protein ACFE9L_11320 [Candidatus Hodarchaeota archaeon]